MAILEVKNICKSFHTNLVLNNVSMAVKKGEIHALVGENGAGKSTLVKIIGGIYEKDSGHIYIDGEEVKFNHPLESMSAGISIVHQELSLVPNLTVGENIYLRREITNAFGFNDWKEINRKSREVFERIGVDIEPTELLGKLSVGMQQLVEIAKAIALDSKLIIMDEPTSSLSEVEIEELFNVVRGLRDQGISIVFISHKLSELFALCDRLTVLRDGEFIGTVDIAHSDTTEVIRMMVGRNIDQLYPPHSSEITDEVILKCENLSRYGFVKDINFELHTGEILGFAGLVGSGRSESVRALIGADKKSSGRILLEGKEVNIKKTSEALKNRIFYVSEDRKTSGLFLMSEVITNVIAGCFRSFKRSLGMLNKAKMEQETRSYIKQMDIRPDNPHMRVLDMSGGNQQKVLLSMALATAPKVLIVDEPTRGVDIGAKSLIHKKLRELAENGVGIIVISSEMPEIIGLSDRVVVFRSGQISAVLDNYNKRLTQEQIMQNAAEL